MPAVNKPPRRATEKGYDIKRMGIPNLGKKGLLRRLIAYLSFTFVTGIHLLCLPKKSFVVAVTNPPFLPLWIWIHSWLRDIYYQVIILDLYPDGLERIGAIASNGVIGRGWAWLNKKAFARAKSIAVLGRDMRSLLISKYNVNPKKIDWIPHWSAFEKRPLPIYHCKNLLSTYGLKNKWVIQYSGNMGLWHDIKMIVKAAERLKKITKIHFLMVGEGIRKDSAVALANKLKLSNVSWRESVPLRKLKSLLGACHVALISQREGLEGVAVPCKIYGILASGKPVLAAVPKMCEVAMVVKEEKCGAVIHPHDSISLANCILKWYRNPILVRKMGNRARQSFEKNYSLPHAVKRFEKSWAKLTNHMQDKSIIKQ